MSTIVLIEDAHERPVPQYVNQTEDGTEFLKGANGHLSIRSSDGQIVSIGSLADGAISDHTDSGTLIGVAKAILRDARQGFNEGIQVAEPSTRTETFTSTEFENYGHKGIHIILDVTDLHADTPSITLALQGQDPVSEKWYDLITGSAVDTVSTTVYRMFPGSDDTNDQLTFKWRVVVTHADTKDISYSIGANLLR